MVNAHICQGETAESAECRRTPEFNAQAGKHGLPPDRYRHAFAATIRSQET
jgi:hypothetical protein